MPVSTPWPSSASPSKPRLSNSEPQRLMNKIVYGIVRFLAGVAREFGLRPRRPVASVRAPIMDAGVLPSPSRPMPEASEAIGQRIAVMAARTLGWVLVILALAAFAYELHASIQAGGYRMIEAGALWFGLDVESLNLAQAIIQRFIHPYLWDPVVAGMLQWPAWSLLGGPGVALVLAFPVRGDQP